MDQMTIGSKFTRCIVSKMIKKTIKKKYGCDIDVMLNNLKVTVDDGQTHVRVNVDAHLSNGELLKLLKNVGF